MEDKIDDAILLLISMLVRTTPADAVMKITQSALNLAHVKETLAGIELAEEEVKPRRGRPPKVAVDET